MTLNQQNRTRIQALCTDLRASSWPTWDAAGTEAAILELSKQMPTDPLGVAVRALSAARNPANRGPATMLHEPATEAVVRALPTPPPNDPERGVGTEWCKTHLCNTTLRTDGERACCYFERIADLPATRVPPVPAPFRPSCPAPAGLRDRVAAALPNASRVGAREMTEQKEQ